MVYFIQHSFGPLCSLFARFMQKPRVLSRFLPLSIVSSGSILLLNELPIWFTLIVFRCQCEPLIIVSLILSHYFLACLFSRGISTGVPKPMAFNSTVRLPDWVPSDHQYAKYTTWTQNHCQWCMMVACFEDVSRLYSVTVGANTLLARVASCLIYTCNRLWCTYHPTSPT